MKTTNRAHTHSLRVKLQMHNAPNSGKDKRESVNAVLLQSACRRLFASIAKVGSSFFFFPEPDQLE